MPSVIIPSLAQSLRHAVELKCSRSYIIKGKVSEVNCDGPGVSYAFNWTVTPLDEQEKANGEEKTLNTQSTQLYLERNSLAYGPFIVRFYVSRYGVTKATVMTYGVIKIVASPLVARIAGGNLVTKGFTQSVVLDASSSYDPDVGTYRRDGIVFTWLCRLVGETWPSQDLHSLPDISLTPGSGTGCFGTGIGKLPSQHTPEKFTISSGVLTVDRSYEFVILLSKGDRKRTATQIVQIIPGDPPNILLRYGGYGSNIRDTGRTYGIRVEHTGYGSNIRDTGRTYGIRVARTYGIRVEHTGYGSNIRDTGRTYGIRVEHTGYGSNIRDTGRTYGIRVEHTGYWSNIRDTGRTYGIRGRTYEIRVEHTGYGSNIRDTGRTYGILVEHTGDGCRADTVYTWTMYKEIDSSGGHSVWQKLENLQSFLMSKASSPGFVINTTNAPPFGGECSISPQNGEALSTNFQLKCRDWSDTETPLKYQFRYRKADGAYVLLYHGAEKTTTCQLPAGMTSNDNFVDIEVFISDSFGATNSTNIRAKVTPKQLAPNTTLASTLESMSVGQSSDMANMLKTGNVDGATQLANAVLDTIVTLSTDTQEKSNVFAQIVASILDQTADIKVENIETLTQVSSIVASATKNDAILSQETQSSSLRILKDLSNVLSVKSRDDDQQSGDLDKGGQNILYGIGNIWNAASKHARIDSAQKTQPSGKANRAKSQSIALAKESAILVKQVSNTLLSRMTAGEKPTVVKTIHMSVVLSRNKPFDVGGSQITDDKTSFTLPAAEQLFGSRLSSLSTVDIQLVATPHNPFSWDSTSSRVTSSVISLACMDNTGSDIDISNLKSPIVMTIPRTNTSSQDPAEKKTFLKPSSGDTMQYRRVSVDIAGSSLQMKIEIASVEVTVVVFVKLRDRPTVDNYDYKTKVPDVSRCQAGQSSNSCSRDPYVNIPGSVFSNKGTYVIGLLYQESETTEPQARRVRRSCGGTGRQKRSCVEIRDPPTTPPPKNVTMIPVYDPARDLNISVSASLSSCLYWSKSLQKWTSDGCEDGPHIKLSPFNTASYEITIETGLWYQCGTTANVAMTITGTENQSDVITIFHEDFPERRLFGRGNIDKFIIHTPSSLGELVCIRIWHDNSGSSPSWFLREIQIQDLSSYREWEFPCNRWLDVIKDDGSLERTIPRSQTKTGQNQSIKEKTTNGFAEEHLWISVIARSPQTYFTRVQRATCCLSLLFSAMIANAMFYNIGGKTEKTFQVGPLQFSLRQIIIGMESSLVVAPLNLLIVQLFKIASKLRREQEKSPGFDYDVISKRRSSSEEELLGKRERSSRLSNFVKFTAYLLSFVCVVVSGTFTIFYSMQWGTDLSTQWLTSMIVSLVQDLFVIQPTKIIVVVVIVTLLTQKCSRKTKCESLVSTTAKQSTAQRYQVEKDAQLDCELQPLSEDKKRIHKERKIKEMKLMSTAKEIALYVLFLILLCLVCYGPRTKHGFLMNNALKQDFAADFEEVTDDQSFYEWLGESLIPGLYATSWYNKQVVTNKAYINNKRSILLGMPRMKQVRVQQVAKFKCSFFKDTWNWLDIFLVLLSVSTVTTQLIKGLYTSGVIRQIHANPYSDLSFDYVVMAIDIEDPLIALLMFVSTLKLLKLTKLHMRIIVISSAMNISMKSLIPFSIIFTVILLAYAQLGILIFGREDAAFSTIYDALATELQMFIGGGSDLWILEKKNRVLGPLYIVSFMVFMGFILMNVFVAILYEAQANQRKNVASLENEFEFLDFMKTKIMSIFNGSKVKVEDSYGRTSSIVPEIEVSEGELKEETRPSLSSSKADLPPETKPKKHREPRSATRINTMFPLEKKQTPVGKVKRKKKKKKKKISSQDNIFLIHDRIKKLTFWLDILEMELTDEDMQVTQMVLQLVESNGGTPNIPTPPPSQSSSVSTGKSPEIFDNNRRESTTLTLSNLIFTSKGDSEEQLQLVSRAQGLARLVIAALDL
ncbi:hypothetical protein QZH41_008953, partial [Actinostola sp. cb2023]